MILELLESSEKYGRLFQVAEGSSAFLFVSLLLDGFSDFSFYNFYMWALA